MSRPVHSDDGAATQRVLDADRPRSYDGLAGPNTLERERHDDVAAVLSSTVRARVTQCPDGLGQHPALAFQYGTTLTKQNSSRLRRRASAAVEIDTGSFEILRDDGESQREFATLGQLCQHH